jgi:hypothetical protein
MIYSFLSILQTELATQNNRKLLPVKQISAFSPLSSIFNLQSIPSRYAGLGPEIVKK